VVVLFPSKSTRAIRKYRLFGAEVFSLPGRMKYFFTDASLLIRLVVSRRSDVIHVFTGASTLFGFFGLVLGRILNIPSAMSIFGREDVTLASQFSRTCFMLSAEIATTIGTNSESTKTLLPGKYRSKCKVLLGGAKLANQEMNSGKSSEKKIVLFVGRLVKRKGVDDLLDAFAIIEKNIPAAQLVIVGDGSEREDLHNKAMTLGLKNVEFNGALFGESLNDEYDRSAVCVLPSKSVPGDPATEGLGLTLIEASMHSKPLVGTTHGGIPEVIKNGVNGFLVPEGDWKSLSEVLTRLLLDDELATRMGHKAFEMASKQFGWAAATDRLLEAYRPSRLRDIASIH
jgi:glycosyltransferase involved in cell wall biosynthesis